MKSTTVRRVALSIAVATALAPTAACTSSGSPGGHARPTAALIAAERSTRKADSARVESTTVMGSMMSMTATGALRWGHGTTGTLTITYTRGTMADAMRRLGTTSMEARYLPDAYYARMGEKFAEEAGGRHWVRYAYDDLERLAGGTGVQLVDQMRNTTPNQSVKLLLASRDVRKAGEEEIRGRHTTHYSGTVDVADLTAPDLKKRFEQAGVTTQTVDIWVDDRDLLVKKVEKGQVATGLLTQTAYYSDYGVKVAAERPPAGDTQDFRKLLEKRH
ncbi:hypothetical protein [Streptomyces sp. S.PNR 29]|uniref:hypothetical protein n=1 Tax=Streptomyces sp. S.PNR 29 TaxID=2973805 RepID=UPI0025B0D6A5|nr:hypothetical protein [Streptomyces sp. S.PNR 29]MDN0193698.1 hypothetical protein [Streptomyces sp. S.PNR 29]